MTHLHNEVLMMKHGSVQLLLKVALMTAPNKTLRAFEISKQIGVLYPSVFQALTSLVEEGLVEKIDRGTYKLIGEVNFTTDDYISLLSHLGEAADQARKVHDEYLALQSRVDSIKALVKETIANL